jgi:phosphoribosyl 1,2-cyclic phosphodiesterase
MHSDFIRAKLQVQRVYHGAPHWLFWMHDAFVAVLSSGSIGNSFLVMSDGRGILIDAGISCKELESRMSSFGAEASQIEGLVLTHEHTDHVRSARRFAEESGVQVFGTRGTLALAQLDGMKTVTIAPAKNFTVGDLHIRPFKVRHLAAEPVAFAITIGAKKVSIASDLGCVTPNAVSEMADSDLLLIEANYDERMLLAGDYPDFLKRAIKGDHGHLSNDDAGVLSMRTATDKTRKIVLVHLSKDNNTPEIAFETVERSLKRARLSSELEVSEHGLPSGPFPLS